MASPAVEEVVATPVAPEIEAPAAEAVPAAAAPAGGGYKVRNVRVRDVPLNFGWHARCVTHTVAERDFVPVLSSVVIFFIGEI